MKRHDVEQNSEEWVRARLGRPTASNFSMLVTSTGEPSKSLPCYAITLAGELYVGRPLDAWAGNKYTEHGHELEDDARRAYAFLHDAEPERIGFVTDDQELYGCSPDSLVGTDGGSEIKCLKAENHIKALLYYRKNKKCPPDYVQQVQGNLLVCERQWWDLFFYHPDLPKLRIRIERDEKLLAALKVHIGLVLAERDRILSELRKAV